MHHGKVTDMDEHVGRLSCTPMRVPHGSWWGPALSLRPRGRISWSSIPSMTVNSSFATCSVAAEKRLSARGSATGRRATRRSVAAGRHGYC